jgi:hypothetical protein
MVRIAIKAFAISLAFLPLTILAQDNNAATAGSPGCGDDSVKFEVKTHKGQNPAQPEAGNALVYFIEDDSNYQSIPKPTTRAGLDGKWVGATHGNSWLAFSVDPGVHHLCASWQFGPLTGLANHMAAAHFKAESGGVYYFEVKDTFLQTEGLPIKEIKLILLDSDEGQLLANKSARSTSVQKK